MESTPEVIDVPDMGRVQAYVDGEPAGFMAYEVRGPVLVAQHTEVDPAYEGHGVGSALVRFVLRRVRDSGMTVLARCSFVSAYIDRHPEVQDLRTAEGQG